MKELKGTKTEKNLQEAFAESGPGDIVNISRFEIELKGSRRHSHADGFLMNV